MLTFEENAKDLPDLLREFYELLPSPMAVIDENYDIVAHFVLNETTADSLYNDTMKVGHWNVEIINEVLERFEKEQKDTVLHIFDGRKRLFYRIRKETAVLGYLVLIETVQPLEEIDGELLYHFGRLIAKELTGHRKEETLSKKTSFLSSLLSSSFASRDVMEKKRETEHIDIRTISSLLLLSMHELSANRYRLFEQDLSSKFPDATILYREKYVLLFAPSLKEDEVLCFLEKYHVHALCLKAITDFFLLPFLYQCAKNLLTYLSRKKKEELLFHEEQYRFLFPLLGYEKREELALMVLPEIKTLHDYDREHSKDYCKTLLVYLEKGRSLKEACHTLNYHKNTITYRLNQMKEKFAVDAFDSRQSLSYTVSLLILDYLSMVGEEN